jgi:hypothetical protein
MLSPTRYEKTNETKSKLADYVCNHHVQNKKKCHVFVSHSLPELPQNAKCFCLIAC